MILTSVQRQGYGNLVWGFDAVYETSRFLRARNLIVGGMVYGSHTTDISGRNVGYRFYVDYPNDLLDVYLSTTYVPEHFIPGMGFISRRHYRNYVSFFRFQPRWFASLGVRRMRFQLWRLFIFQHAHTGEVESWEYGASPFGFELQSGDEFELNVNFEYDHPKEDFWIADKLHVPAGPYYMRSAGVELNSYTGRRFAVETEFSFGTYYTGKIQNLNVALALNMGKHLNLSGGWEFNHLDMPEGELFSHQVSMRVIYAFNPRLNASVFGQWNSEEDFIGYNFRLHWIPRIGSDFYLVFNQGYDERLRFKRLQETSAGLKLVWRFAF